MFLLPLKQCFLLCFTFYLIIWETNSNNMSTQVDNVIEEINTSLENQRLSTEAYLAVYYDKYDVIGSFYENGSAYFDKAIPQQQKVSKIAVKAKNAANEYSDYLKHIKRELDDSLERHFHIFKKDILNSIFMYQSSVECPMDTFRFGPTCVSFQNGEKTWDEWRQFCTNLNGDIAKLEYRELPLSILLKVLPALKQTVVTTLEIGRSLNIYVGAEDKDGKGDWKWVSKSRLPLDDPRWLFKEPNLPAKSGRHCLSIKIQRLSEKSYNVGLDDISCGLKLGAVCEHQRIY